MHTPGPWHVDPKRALRVVGANDETICSTGTSDSIRNQWEDNARLIAAAPDLLEALEELLAADVDDIAARQKAESAKAKAKAKGE